MMVEAVVEETEGFGQTNFLAVAEQKKAVSGHRSCHTKVDTLSWESASV
jgi:hypothetical protein